VENAAGAGGTVGRSFDEVAAILEAAGAGGALGVCLDTQHLWASGVPFGTVAESDDTLDAFDRAVGLAQLRCLHVNDSKVAFGANRDRHENLGDGTIGLEGLGAFLSHPALADCDAVLEVPGAGDGPRAEDLAAAHRALELGRSRRAGP
jgi:deoxyribonuclease-4